MFKHIIILFSLTAFCQIGHGYSCPSYLKTNEQAIKLFNKLEKYKHITELGGCKVEILTCDNSSFGSSSNPIAEILLTTEKERLGYTEIKFFEDEDTSLNKTQLVFTRRTFNYFLWDYAYENEYGRTQKWDLRFIESKRKPRHLDAIELGTYSTNKRLRQPSGNDSRWFICNELKN